MRALFDRHSANIEIWNVPNADGDDGRWIGDRRREAEGRDGRVTIVDVARHAGVSKSTVSLVLSGSSLVAEADARARQRGDGRSSATSIIAARRRLRGAKSGVLGMVINDLSNPFFVEMAIGIEAACQGGAFIPFLANTVENPGAPIASHPLDARARRGGLGAFARDRHFGRRIEAADRRHAGRAGDAARSRPQGFVRRAGEQGGRAKGDRSI